VIRGTATLTSGDVVEELAMGQFAVVEAGERHNVANQTEQRLICLAVRSSS
jgi:mannose-6-phosphate isomerase-like protein (cupin superfamily)